MADLGWSYMDGCSHVRDRSADVARDLLILQCDDTQENRKVAIDTLHDQYYRRLRISAVWCNAER